MYHLISETFVGSVGQSEKRVFAAVAISHLHYFIDTRTEAHKVYFIYIYSHTLNVFLQNTSLSLL